VSSPGKRAPRAAADVSEWAPSKVEVWETSRLRANTQNPREHDDEQVARIADAIRRFGWTSPLLVAADGQIVAGHGRLLAARRIGRETVPVIVLDHLGEDERRALMVADNRLAELSSWDEDQLAGLLGELEDLDVDLTVGLGYSEGELAELRTESGEQESVAPDPEPPDPEPVKDPITREGDVWTLGRHVLVVGNSDPEYAEVILERWDAAHPKRRAKCGGVTLQTMRKRRRKNAQGK
jgi:ParB-like chromosome segregation protein Spo0J